MAKNDFHSAKSKAHKGAKKMNLKFINLFFFVAAALLGGFYLVNVNELTVQGFVLQDLKSKAGYLAGEKTEIEEKINSAQSFYSLNTKVDGLNMVEASNIEYISDSGQAVAKR